MASRLFGDVGKFVSNGGASESHQSKKNPANLTVEVIFSQTESNVRLHGCCESPVEAMTGNHALKVSYDPDSRHFYVDADAKWLTGPVNASDGTRRMLVTLRKD